MLLALSPPRHFASPTADAEGPVGVLTGLPNLQFQPYPGSYSQRYELRSFSRTIWGWQVSTNI
jgi:hypothetical protein